MSLQVWGVILIAWGAVLWFALALCRAAALADRAAGRMTCGLCGFPRDLHGDVDPRDAELDPAAFPCERWRP